jgi:endophilin-B
VEAELKESQEEYDKQLGLVRKCLQEVENIHTEHLKSLQEFLSAQALYYSQCHQIMADVQKEIPSR